MATNDHNDLARLLDEERRCLKNGALGDLAPLIARKQALVAALSSGRSDLPGLRKTLMQAEENQRLIAAALKGIQSAQVRLRAIRDAGNGMVSYTAKGRAVRLDQGVSQVERRA